MKCFAENKLKRQQNQFAIAVKGDCIGVASLGIVVAIDFLEERQEFWEKAIVDTPMCG